MTKAPFFFLFMLFWAGLSPGGDGGFPGRPDGFTAGSHWVFFTDKQGGGFDPYDFFDPKAIDRRLRHGQSLIDPVDFPVTRKYLDAVAQLVDSSDVVSRWLNAVHVYAGPEVVRKLQSLPFVDRVETAHGMMLLAGHRTGDEGYLRDGVRGSADPDEGGISSGQIESLAQQIGHLQGQYFQEHGLNGAGFRIAVLDAGFPGVDKHPAFEHLRRDNRIVATWDFHRNRPDVYRFNDHGTMVLSMIAGQMDGHMMGLATGAEFLLARTEIWREPYFEEKYWLAAVEWADRMGADIINSSLGYSYHRYFTEDMDGKTSLVAQAARIAARKGILVINSAGNEGENERWRIVITPADVDSVLTIGAVEYPSMLRTSYSSVGSTPDIAIKPNLVSMGNVVLAKESGLTNSRGTSFSAPLVAGFAACLWQKFPAFSNMQLFEVLERSGSLYPYYDLSHGYGVPQAGFFFENPVFRSAPTFDLTRQGEGLAVTIRHNPLNVPEGENGERYLFYHITDPEGIIEQYFVLRVDQPDVVVIDTSRFVPGQRVMVHFEGYTASRTF